ncbi:hypothetical protein H4R33_003097 [Dimargaris cristalligena]|nr:hypothetical protein H4R33_003097 [Dimargaris cristalligena]
MRSTILTYATLLVSSAHLAQVIQASKLEASLQSTEHDLGDLPEFTLPDALLSDLNLTSFPSDNDTEDPMGWDNRPQQDGWSTNGSSSAHHPGVGSATAPVELTGPTLNRKRQSWTRYLDDDDINVYTELQELLASDDAAGDGTDMYAPSGSAGGIGSLPKKPRQDNLAMVEPIQAPPHLSSIDAENLVPVDAANPISNSQASQPHQIIPVPKVKKVEMSLLKQHFCSLFISKMARLLEILIYGSLDNVNFEKARRIIEVDPGNYMSYLAFRNDISFYGLWGKQQRRVSGYTLSTLNLQESGKSLNLLAILLGERPEVAIHLIRKALGGFTPEQKQMLTVKKSPTNGQNSRACHLSTMSEEFSWANFRKLPLWVDLATNLLLHNRVELAQEIFNLLEWSQLNQWTFMVQRAYWALFMDQETAVRNMMAPVECGSVEPGKVVELCYTLNAAMVNGTLGGVFEKYDDFSALYPILGLPGDFIFPENDDDDDDDDDDMDYVFVSFPEWG